MFTLNIFIFKYYILSINLFNTISCLLFCWKKQKNHFCFPVVEVDYLVYYILLSSLLFCWKKQFYINLYSYSYSYSYDNSNYSSRFFSRSNINYFITKMINYSPFVLIDKNNYLCSVSKLTPLFYRNYSKYYKNIILPDNYFYYSSYSDFNNDINYYDYNKLINYIENKYIKDNMSSLKLNTSNYVSQLSSVNSIIIKPITLSNTLTPISLENYNKNIYNLENWLNKLPNDNFVKKYLLDELNKPILVSSFWNENYDEYFNNISKESNFIKKPNLNSSISNIYNIDEIKTINDIYRDKYSYTLNFPLSFNNVFMKKDNRKWIISNNINEKNINILLQNNIKEQYYSCIYIIVFNNIYYYYIGSSINIFSRIKDHYKRINDNLNLNSDLIPNNIYDYFIHSEKKNNKYESFNIFPLYLNTNYLIKFLKINPNYLLNKGEYLLLHLISDINLKILEESSIKYLNSRLNTLYNVSFNYINIYDTYFNEYLFKPNEYKKYFIDNKYIIKYIIYKYNLIIKNKIILMIIGILKKIIPNIIINNISYLIFNKILNIKPIIKTNENSYTENEICIILNISREELFKYKNKEHTYINSIYKCPIIIEKVK